MLEKFNLQSLTQKPLIVKPNFMKMWQLLYNLSLVFQTEEEEVRQSLASKISKHAQLHQL